MIKRASLLVSFLLAALVMAAFADDESIVITTSQTSYPGYGNGYPDYDSGYAGYNGAYPDYSQSPDSVQMYQEYYTFNQGGPSATGPGQYGTYGSAPTYLVINGQTMPYDPSYVSANSLWIQGKTSWTQYIKCPLGASYKVLAVSSGGPATMVETYPTGYQQAKQYNFFSGYTPGVFEADTEGRHTLAFYLNGQKSNSVIIDVVPYSGNTFVNNPPSGQTTTKTVIIGIGTTGQGSGQPQGNGCDITGTWNYGADGPYNIINADGMIVAKQTREGEVFDSGTWYVIDASKRQYGATWQSGWKHIYTLSVDCSSLDASGRYKGGTEEPGHATRVTSDESNGYSSTTVESGQPQGNGCDITGTWNFGTNGPYNIVNADGTITAKDTLEGEIFDSGTWNVIDAAKRQYGFTWQSGWKHTFTLSADCSSLDGTGNWNGGYEEADHAKRVTSVQSGGYSTTSTGNLGQSSGQTSSAGSCTCPPGKWKGLWGYELGGGLITSQAQLDSYCPTEYQECLRLGPEYNCNCSCDCSGQSQGAEFNSFHPSGGILIDGADQGFDPNAHTGGLLTDSAEDMEFPQEGEQI